jgi:hypothetical protein
MLSADHQWSAEQGLQKMITQININIQPSSWEMQKYLVNKSSTVPTSSSS